jgi:hypothetical protein
VSAVSEDQRVLVLAFDALFLGIILLAVFDGFLAKAIDSDEAVGTIGALFSIIDETSNESIGSHITSSGSIALPFFKFIISITQSIPFAQTAH